MQLNLFRQDDKVSVYFNKYTREGFHSNINPHLVNFIDCSLITSGIYKDEALTILEDFKRKGLIDTISEVNHKFFI